MLHLLFLRPKKAYRCSSFHPAISHFLSASSSAIYSSFFSLTLRIWVSECSTSCSSALKHTMHGIIHCIATSLLCLHTLACWPCLAGGRAHLSLWYIFFIFKDKLFHFFASPHFPGAYHPPLPHHPSRFFLFKCSDSWRPFFSLLSFWNRFPLNVLADSPSSFCTQIFALSII